MTIAINFISTLANNDLFFHDYFFKIASKNLQYNFVFIVDDAYNNPLPNAINIVIVKTKIPRKALPIKLWCSFQLPKIIKQNKATILFNINTTWNIKTICPQYLFIENVSFLKKENKKAVIYFDKIQKIITPSNFVKTFLVDNYKVPSEKISILFNAAPAQYASVNLEVKQQVLHRLSADTEYFLCVVQNTHTPQLINLLKAFSLFKKWQKSNMQLIIVTHKNNFSADFITNHTTYKYKEAVNLISNINDDDLSKIIASAYCFINAAGTENYQFLLKSMQCHVPVIAINSDVYKEICGDAILYTPENDYEDLSKKMILLYKDEKTRNELIALGINQSLQYKFEETENKIIQLIEQAVKQ